MEQPSSFGTLFEPAPDALRDAASQKIAWRFSLGELQQIETGCFIAQVQTTTKEEFTPRLLYQDLGIQLQAYYAHNRLVGYLLILEEPKWGFCNNITFSLVKDPKDLEPKGVSVVYKDNYIRLIRMGEDFLLVLRARKKKG